MTEEELTRVLNTQLAVFFGQMTKHFDEKLETKADKEQVERLQNTMDGIAKRLDEDEQERAAANQQLGRHENWIGQLAQNTKTTLVPEQ